MKPLASGSALGDSIKGGALRVGWKRRETAGACRPAASVCVSRWFGLGYGVRARARCEFRTHVSGRLRRVARRFVFGAGVGFCRES